jgi:hypothetical protein
VLLSSSIPSPNYEPLAKRQEVFSVLPEEEEALKIPVLVKIVVMSQPLRSVSLKDRNISRRSNQIAKRNKKKAEEVLLRQQR